MKLELNIIENEHKTDRHGLKWMTFLIEVVTGKVIELKIHRDKAKKGALLKEIQSKIKWADNTKEVAALIILKMIPIWEEQKLYWDEIIEQRRKMCKAIEEYPNKIN